MSERKRPRVTARRHARNPEFSTQQNFVDESNINTVIGRHMRGPARQGLPIGNPNATRQGRFTDVSSESFHDMLNRVTDAQQAFMTLPARIRGRFSNDPYMLLRFLEKPENREEAERLGLLQARPAHETAPDPSGHLNPENLEDEGQKPDPEAQPRPLKKGAK